MNTIPTLFKTDISAAHAPAKVRSTFSSFHQKDSELWKEFKQGNEGAFNYIYTTYFPILYSYGLQFTRDQELVKDLIQDFFIDLRKSREKLGNTNAIKFYLFKSMRRKIARYLKKHQKISYQDTLTENKFQIVISHETALINRQLTEEKNRQLQNALSKLTPKQREAIFYVYYENLSYKEVASIMGLIHVRSARNIVYKAIEAIKKQIEITF